MKRLLLLFAILIAAIAAPSVADAQFRYAAVVGPNISSLKFKQDLVGVSQTTGFQVGAQGEVIFPGLGFGVDLGLFYNQLGAKVNLGERKIWASQGYGDERVYLHYIQIPLHLRFKWTRMNGLEDFVAPFVYGGPDFTILAAHGGCDAFDYAGGELGITAGLGFEILKRWQISGSYTWGMTYALKTVLLDDFSARNRHWSVRLTYFF